MTTQAHLIVYGIVSPNGVLHWRNGISALWTRCGCRIGEGWGKPSRIPAMYPWCHRKGCGYVKPEGG